MMDQRCQKCLVFFFKELVTNLHKKLWNFELPLGQTPFNLPRTQSSEQKVAIP